MEQQSVGGAVRENQKRQLKIVSPTLSFNVPGEQ